MANNSKCLFGTETELALRVESMGVHRPVPADWADAILDDVADRYAHVPSPQPPPHRRLFLRNGGCVYTDQGFHPEVASSEHTNPFEQAAQALALREIVAEAADSVGHVYGVGIRVVANNQDYAFGCPRTYGQHLNFLVRGVTLQLTVEQIAPLLAAMPVIAGSGRLSLASKEGCFALSQRAAYMAFLLGKRTTAGSRAMITQKDEPLCNNGLRLHLLSMSTPISPWQLVLVPAIIGLTLRVIEGGHDIAKKVTLDDPVRALHAVSSDPSLKAKLPLAAGGVTTALDILDHYYNTIQRYRNKVALPDWAGDILSTWAELMATLRVDPFCEHGRLDWVQKLLLFTDELQREGLGWEEFSKWTYVLASVRRLKSTFPDLDPLGLTNSATARTQIRRSALGVLERYFAKNKLSWREFPRVWRLANRLCSLCLEYHTLNPGRYESNCPLVTPQMIRQARTLPPKGTRAEIRAAAIGNAEAGATASWTYVSSGGKRLQMLDAFGEQATWENEQKPSKPENQNAT